MKTILVILGAIGALLAVLSLAKRKFVAESKVKMADIPAIFDRLRAAGKDGSFAVFIFTPAGKSSPDEAINIQFSNEGGRIGLDWVLLGSPNVRDKEKFVQFVERLGYKVSVREMNDVKYLRVEEGGSLPQLCEASLRDLYSISPEADLDLIPEGFTWP